MTEWTGDERFLEHLRQLLQHSARSMGSAQGSISQVI